MADVNFLSGDGQGEKNVEKKKEDIPVEWSKGQKKNEQNKAIKNDGVESADISSWLESLKDNSSYEGKGIQELKNSKEALAEYQKAYKKTKKMAEMKEGIKNIADTGEIIKAEKKGIADIIKKKLSFGAKTEEDFSTLKTNLIQSEGVTYFDWKEKVKVLSINIILTFLIIGIAYGYLYYQEGQVDKKIQALNKEISTDKERIASLELEAREIDKFQERAKIVGEKLNSHVYWTNLFVFLEKKILADVYLDNVFEGDINGSFKLFSRGKNFTNLTNQGRVLWNEELVKKATISGGEIEGSGVSGSGQEVKFSLELEVDPAIFYK